MSGLLSTTEHCGLCDNAPRCATAARCDMTGRRFVEPKNLEQAGRAGDDVECTACSTPARCKSFGCAIVSSMANQKGTRAEWWQVDATLVRMTDEERNGDHAWKPGGRHGAKCEGGPLDGQVVLVLPTDMATPIADLDPVVVDGHSNGAYWWAESERRAGRWVGSYSVHFLEWQRATPVHER